MTIAPPVIDALRNTFYRTEYTIEGLHEALGDVAFQALFRHEPVPVWRATAPATTGSTAGAITASCENSVAPEAALQSATGLPADLHTLIRILLLGDTASASTLCRLFQIDNPTWSTFLDSGIFVPVTDTSDIGEELFRVALDIRPVDTGFGTHWVFSDLDGALFPAATKDDHVLGVGEASLSLLQATPVAPVHSLLDLGTGSGIQALHASHYAQRITATDLSPRCCELTEATLRINGISVDYPGSGVFTDNELLLPQVELLRGSWFEPVVGQEFDAIVANPPFVVASEHITHSYRDSGLDLDGATQLMMENAPQHLKVGGHATILGAWVHQHGQNYRSRLAQWIPEHGVDAWIVERDRVDPALYVSTWMRDSSRDPSDPQWFDHATQWLQHFEDNKVDAIGFGMIFLRRTDAPSTLLVEELTAPEGDALASESLERWKRWDHLQSWTEDEFLSQRFTLSPHAVFMETSRPAASGQGTETESISLWRSDMPSFRHTIDEPLRALLNGLSREGLPVRDIAELLCATRGWEWSAFQPAVVTTMQALYLHGIINM